MDVGVREDVVGCCFQPMGRRKGARAYGDLSFGFDSLGSFLGFRKGGGVHECFHQGRATGFFNGRVAALFVEFDGLLKEVVLVFEDEIYIWACTFGYPHGDGVEYWVQLNENEVSISAQPEHLLASIPCPGSVQIQEGIHDLWHAYAWLKGQSNSSHNFIPLSEVVISYVYSK